MKKKEVFSINASDITEQVDDFHCKQTSHIYYSFDEAVEAAREVAVELHHSYPQCWCVYVMVGEYETGDGNIYGEPEAIYSISSQYPAETIEARREANYIRHTVDEYYDLDDKFIVHQHIYD